jgi:hypothetical protein
VEIFDLDSKSLFREEKIIDLADTDVVEVSSIASSMAATKGVAFVVLNLRNSTGGVISHNVYWISKDNQYKSLSDMPKSKVDVSMINTVKGKSESVWTIKISNPTDKLVFFVRPQLMVESEEVLPGFWTGSYVTLAPSESVTLTVSCPVSVVKGKKPHIKVSGWNVESVDLKIN